MNTKKLSLFEYSCLSYYIIRGTFINISINTILRIAKQDSIISILIGIILGFIPLLVFNYISKKNPKDNILTIIKTKFGKLGNIINFTICLFILLFVCISMWSVTDFISSQYLYKTPNLVIIITISIALYFILNKSINVLARVAVVFFYLCFILYLISFIGLFFQSDINNLKPIFEHGITPILHGTLNYISYNILPLFFLLIIPRNSIQNSKQVTKANILMYIFANANLIGVAFLLVSIYGINFSNILQYPVFHLLKRITIFDFIQRVDSILAAQWLFDVFITVSVGLYFIKTYIEKEIKIKSNVYTNFMLITLMIIITNNIFKNNTIANNFFTYNFPIIIPLFLLFIPLILLIIIRKRKV